jgi:hypothetical protein
MESEQWRPSPEIDAAVREWMRTQGLPVNSTRYYFTEEVYAWRHETPGGSPTLWVAQPVLEDHSPADLVAGLDRLRLADRMRGTPKTRFLVVDENGLIAVRPWAHGPDRGR